MAAILSICKWSIRRKNVLNKLCLKPFLPNIPISPCLKASQNQRFSDVWWGRKGLNFIKNKPSFIYIYISFLLMFIRKCHRNVTIISPIDAGKSFILFSRNTRTVNCWNKTSDIDYPKITFQPDLNPYSSNMHMWCFTQIATIWSILKTWNTPTEEFYF